MARLRKFYRRGRWRKGKGIAAVHLHDGTLRSAGIHWYEARSIGIAKSSRSAVIWTDPMAVAREKFVVCIGNKSYEVALEPRKIHRALPDADAARHYQLRVIDESGGDYLYPESLRCAVLAAV